LANLYTHVPKATLFACVPSGVLEHVLPLGQSFCPIRHHFAQVPSGRHPCPGAHPSSLPGQQVPGPTPLPAPPTQSLMSGKTTMQVAPAPQTALGFTRSQPAVHDFQPGTGVPM